MYPITTVTREHSVAIVCILFSDKPSVATTEKDGVTFHFDEEYNVCGLNFVSATISIQNISNGLVHNNIPPPPIMSHYGYLDERISMSFTKGAGSYIARMVEKDFLESLVPIPKKQEKE
jgi:hypothetical protein